MDVAFLRACTRTRLTAYAIFSIGDRHDFVAHVITIFVIAFKRFFDKLQHLPATNLIAAATADAFIYIDRFYKFRDPHFAAPRIPYDCRHTLSFPL